ADVAVQAVHLLREGPGRVWTPMAEARLGQVAVVGRGGLPLELAVTAGPDPEAAVFVQRQRAGAAGADPEGGRGEDVAITARRQAGQEFVQLRRDLAPPTLEDPGADQAPATTADPRP